jgi:phosphopantetheinyl transferase (holo-ACP synthase)
MIGNDIIDLNELHRHPRAGHIRFRRKILAEPEMEWLRLSVNPALDIWKLWALKESAYKCYFQRTRHRFFSPRKFICQMVLHSCADEEQAIVVSPVGLLYAEIYQTEQYIHTLCGDERERLQKANVHELTMPEPDVRAQSAFLREKALHLIAQYRSCAPDELTWTDAAGHPQLLQLGALLPIDISLSHHGRWGAAVFCDH